MELNGASAIVVGGAGGLGAATTRRLATAGAHVVIADLAIEGGKALAAELGANASFIETNVLDEDSVNAAIEIAVGHGPLRVSVDTHGGPSGGRTLSRHGEPLALASFESVVSIFLTGAFNVLRLAAAAMARNEPSEDGERGLVVNTASIAGFEGTIGQVAYSAAKGGVIGMTLTAARDLAVVGVRVITIAPGTFMTPAYGMPLEELDAIWGPNIPFPKRMGQPDEYAKLVLAACDNTYLNGEVIRLDGAVRFTPKMPNG